MEQRRSQRQSSRLPVDVVEGVQRFTAHTENVSRHGIFLATEAELRERFLVQLTLQLPDGPLSATGFVARHASSAETRPGVGIQFFALSAAAKSRWDAYISALSGLTPRPALAQAHPERATFLLKLRDRARLEEFASRNYAVGGLYMATPLLKAEGAPISLVVVHPESEAELVIEGEVARVCNAPPKGMDVRFDVPNEAARARFDRFIRTGRSPGGPPPPPSGGYAVPSPPRMPTGDFALDIDVDESALEDSASFSWDDVSDYRMVLDFELTRRDTADIEPEPSPLEVTLELERPPLLSSDAVRTLEQPAPPELVARARGSNDVEPAQEGSTRPVLPSNASRRQVWTWPAGAEQGSVRPRDALDPPPPRFPPPRPPSTPAAPKTPPQVLDLGPEFGSSPPEAQEELHIPILDPVEEGEAEAFLAPPPEGEAAPAEAPETEAPSEAPEIEAPAVDETVVDAPEIEAPALKAPALEAPAVDETVVDAPEIEAPEVEAPPDWGALCADACGPRHVEVWCEACAARLGDFELGAAPGPLGLVADVRPYWNPDKQRLVGVRRLRRSEQRAEIAARVAEAGVDIPASVLFDVADLNRPPADPNTGGRVRVNAVVKALMGQQDALSPGVQLDLPSAKCPRCKAQRLVAAARALDDASPEPAE